MERKRMVHEEGLLRTLFMLAVLFLCVADSHKHPALHNHNEIISQETVPLHPTKTIPVMTDGTNTLVTESTDALNATAGTSNTTDSPDAASPESTPPEPKCLQGWAIFLICFGAVLTVVLLAGIPMMVYCILQGRQLPPQTCPSRYSCKIYTTPEEQAFPLE